MLKFLENMKSSFIEDNSVKHEGNFFKMLKDQQIDIVYDDEVLDEKVTKTVEQKEVTPDIHEFYVSYNPIELQKIIQSTDKYKTSNYSYDQLKIMFTGQTLLVDSDTTTQVEYEVPIIQHINDEDVKVSCPIRVDITKNGSLNFNLDVREMLNTIDSDTLNKINKYIKYIDTYWGENDSIFQTIELVNHYKRDLIYTYPKDFNIEDVTIEIDCLLDFKNQTLISTPDYEMQVPNNNFKIEEITIPTQNIEKPIIVELKLNRDNFNSEIVSLLSDVQDFTGKLTDEDIDKYLFHKGINKKY